MMHKCAFLLGHPNGVATTRFINTDSRGINHSGKEHEAKKMAMDKMAHANLFSTQLFLQCSLHTYTQQANFLKFGGHYQLRNFSLATQK